MTAALKSIFTRRQRAPIAEIETEEETTIRPIEWSLLWKMVRMLHPYRAQYAVGTCVCYVHATMDMLSPAFLGTVVGFVGAYVGAAQTGQETFLSHLIRRMIGGTHPETLSQTQAIRSLLGLILLWAL